MNPQTTRDQSPAHHHTVREADARRLGASLAVILAFMAAEIVVGLQARSLALLADAGHMLTDAGSVALSIWAIRLALRPATTQWTFGHMRAEILAAAINGVSLVVVGGLLLYGASIRLVHPPDVKGLPMVAVAAAGVVVNIASAGLLARTDRSNLNLAAAFRHLLTDLWAFIGTLGAGLVIYFTGFSRADGIASVLIVVLMFTTAFRLLRDSGRILFEAAPANVDLAAVREHLLAVEHVTDVHDLHAWVITSDLPALSAHVVVEDSCFQDGHAPQILDSLQECLSDHFDVEHSTFQLESPSHTSHEHEMH